MESSASNLSVPRLEPPGALRSTRNDVPTSDRRLAFTIVVVVFLIGVGTLLGGCSGHTSSYTDGYNTAAQDNQEIGTPGVADTGLQCQWIVPANDNPQQFIQGCEDAIHSDATPSTQP